MAETPPEPPDQQLLDAVIDLAAAVSSLNRAVHVIARNSNIGPAVYEELGQSTKSINSALAALREMI